MCFCFSFFSLIVKSIKVFQLIRCVVHNVYESMSISLENEFKWSEKKDRKIKLRNSDSLKRMNTNRAQMIHDKKKHKTGDHTAQGFTLNFTHKHIVRCSFVAFRPLLVAAAVVGMTRMHTNEFVYHANFIFIPWKFVILIMVRVAMWIPRSTQARFDVFSTTD